MNHYESPGTGKESNFQLHQISSALALGAGVGDAGGLGGAGTGTGTSTT